MKLLKCIAINIITPLSYLINLSLETGIVPTILNISLIHQVSVPTFTPKFHSSAVTQYTITYTFVLNDLSLSEHMVEFFSMQQHLT